MNRSEEAGYKQQVFFLSAGGNVVSIYWNESKSRRRAAKDVTFVSHSYELDWFTYPLSFTLANQRPFTPYETSFPATSPIGNANTVTGSPRPLNG